MLNQNHTLSSIITFNLYTQRYTHFNKKGYTHPEKLNFKSIHPHKIAPIISTLSNTDLQSTKINIPKALEEHEIEAYLQVQIYEALELQDDNYHISAYELKNHEQTLRTFYTFVVSHSWMEHYFRPWIKETRYMDTIVPMPLVYESLFRHTSIPSQGVSCFIYETQSQTTLTFYQDSKFIYVRSCTAMIDTLLDIIIEVIEYVQQLANVSSISYLYIQGNINNLSSTIQTLKNRMHLTIKSIDSFKPQPYHEVETLDYLLFLYANDVMFSTQNLSHSIPYTFANLSPFIRNKPFFKRTSGQIVLFATLATVVGFILLFYTLFLGYRTQEKLHTLQDQEYTLKQVIHLKQEQNDKKQQKQKVLNQSYEKEKQRYSTLKNKILTIYKKKNTSPIKSEKIYFFGKLLLSYNIQLINIVSEGNIFYFTLKSQNKKDFIQVMEALLQKHTKEIFDISMQYQGTHLKKNRTLHQTIITVSFK